MTVKHRQYTYKSDFKLVGNFLINHYQPDNVDGNWFQPTWEYMHSHSMLDRRSLSKIRIWEEDQEIVAVIHYESNLGEVFFQVHPEYGYLKKDMLDYAEMHLLGTTTDETQYLQAFINDFDELIGDINAPPIIPAILEPL